MKARYQGPSVKFNYNTEKLIVVPMFIQDLTRCMINNKRFIIIPTQLVDENYGHTNVVVIDKLSKTIQRFDPHGSYLRYYISDQLSFETNSSKMSKKFTDELEDLFSQILPDYDFEDMDFIGPQHREKLVGWNWKKVGDSWTTSPGYCGIWTFWFIALRLQFPNVPTKTLLDRAYRYLDRYGYSNFIEDFGYTVHLLGENLRVYLEQFPQDERNHIIETLMHT